jgi:hypothetical protein
MNPIIDLSDRLPLRRVWLIILAWAAIALVQAITLYSQQGLRFFDAIVSAALNYSVMALLVWASCRLNVRWRLWSRPPLGALAAYLAVGLAGIVIWCTLELVAMRFWVGPYFWTIVFADTWMFQLLGTVFTYGAAFGLGLVVQTFDREHEAREREARLEATAHAAEIDAIKGQLRPHFLLNSLNSILALIDENPAEARRMIGRLSSLCTPSSMDSTSPLFRSVASSIWCATISRSSRSASAIGCTSPLRPIRRRSKRWCRRSCCSRSSRTR